MKNFLSTALFVTLLCSAGFSQWTYEAAWPDTNYKGGAHGIAVDPDGKVWTSGYYYTAWVAPDTVQTCPIFVFNPDGSLLSTLYTVTTGAVTDTLKGRNRGLSVAADGDILYVQSGPSRILKINYQTLQGAARHDITEVGSSPTKAAASSDGTIYVGPVVGGGTTAIATYDKDLNYLGNAVTGPANIARTMEVSPDGLSIYWTMFTGGMGIDIYTRADELSSFTLTDSLFRGMSIETAAWNPVTGNLWISNDSRGTGGYNHLTWYEYSVTAGAIIGSFTLPSDPAPADEFPRGLAFSADGMTAYVGLFGSKYDRIFKISKQSGPPPSNWTYNAAWPDTNYKGGAHGIAVDPDGKVWTSGYYYTAWVAPDTVQTCPIFVFNPDGSLLSTLYTVTTGAVTDTLKGRNRGLSVAADGDILYVQSGPSRILKINYQTLQGAARHDITEVGSSPTKAAASSDGTIYVGPVVGGGTTAIATYDKDLNYLGNAVTGPANIARTMEVSPDGLSIYWTMFTGGMGIDIYTRADELSSFTLTDSLFRGMSIETVAWNPASGNLWVSNDSRGTGGYNHLTWYEYSVTKRAIVGSFTLPSDPAPADEFPRGLAFSTDGMTAYVGLFGTKYDRIYKFTSNPTGINDEGLITVDGYKLSQNYPNPFNPSTKINFELPMNGYTTLRVYDILGREVAVLIQEELTAGSHLVNFDAVNLASGTYIYQLNVNGIRITNKMLLLK